MKKVDSTVLLVILMALVSMMCLFFSAAYSYVIKNKTSSKQTITTGNLEATITYNALTNVTMEPMNNESGLGQTEYSTVTIEKNNAYSVFYELNIGYNNLLPSGKTSDDLLPLEHVNVALFPMTNGIVGNEPVMGPVHITDLPVSNYDGNIINTKYKLFVSNFSSGEDSHAYALKFWLDENLSDTYDGKIVNLGTQIVQEPLLSKAIYNLKGKVTFDGTNVTNALVSLHGGLKSYNSTDGNFSLDDVVEGVYTLEVAYGDNVYETTIDLKSGDSIKVTEASILDSYQNIQEAAYLNKTTVTKILQKSSLTDSLASSNKDLVIPKHYTVQGTSAINKTEINNIVINLSSDGSITLGYMG